jgi:type II secretory pathway component PulM
LRQFQDNAVSVQFNLDDVEADALLRWLEELSSRHGIRARSVQMELLPQAGRVRATLVLRGSAS